MTRGSMDDIMDIVEKLDASGDAYVLMIGRTGEGVTSTWGNAHDFHGDVEGQDGLNIMEGVFPQYVKSVRAEQKEKGEQDEKAGQC